MVLSQILQGLLLAAIATCVSGNSAVDSIYVHDQEVIDWYLSGVRGAWFGTFRGFWADQAKMDKRCLATSVEDEILEVMYFMAYGDWSDIFDVADAISSGYYDNKEFCLVK